MRRHSEQNEGERQDQGRQNSWRGNSVPDLDKLHLSCVMCFRNYTVVAERGRGKEDKNISIFTPHAEYRPRVKRRPKNLGHINTTEKSNRKIKLTGAASLWCREMQTYVRLGKWSVSNRRFLLQYAT